MRIDAHMGYKPAWPPVPELPAVALLMVLPASPPLAAPASWALALRPELLQAETTMAATMMAIGTVDNLNTLARTRWKGSILADGANGSISAMGGCHAGCASVAVLVGTTSPSHGGTERSITNTVLEGQYGYVESIDRRTDETTSTGAILFA